jgi:hypothetical protein
VILRGKTLFLVSKDIRPVSRKTIKNVSVLRITRRDSWRLGNPKFGKPKDTQICGHLRLTYASRSGPGLCLKCESDTLSALKMSNILTEKPFEKSRDGKDYRLKATAVFILEGIDEGKWYVSFDVQTGQRPLYPLDQRPMSKDAAQRAAEQAFESGRVDQLIDSYLQAWINTGAIKPVPRNS